MPFQTNSRVLAAIKREVTMGTAAAGGAGAQQMRIVQSPGLELKRAQIQSNEKRADGLRTMGRLGGKSADGSYNLELTMGGVTDLLLESIMRSVWTAAVVITEVTGSAGALTIAASGSNFTLTRTGGSWITDGVRVGDVARLTNHATAANNDKNLRVVSISALVLTVAAPSGFAAAASDAAWTLTILKKLKTATSPTRYSHTIEQYDVDIDLSELFVGARLTGLQLSFQPGQPATLVPTFMALDRTLLAAGQSPYFTGPTLTTGLALVADDSAIRYAGADVATFTGFQIDFQINAAGQAVIGSFVSPDIFDNDLVVTAQVSGLRQDFANLTRFDAETEFELSILLTEPETDPKDCLGIFLPRVKIAQLSAPFGGGDGAKIETLNLMVGPKDAATGYDAGIATISSSAA